MRKFPGILIVIIFVLLLTGCAGSATPIPILASFTPEPPTATVTPVPTATSTITFTPLPTHTPTLTPTPTPVLTFQGPGAVTVPILLYHRIAEPEIPSEYYVSPEQFREQMQALKDWGYTTISISLLTEAINAGAYLPERPVVISFDDGDITVYSDAFPIMQEFGFTGINYLVGNRMDVDGYMRPEQVKELIDAGWEVGSHSMSHADLTLLADPTWEIEESRRVLEDALGVSVETFAYPFGLENSIVTTRVQQFYTAAVGLGANSNQTPYKLYYLWRRPTKYGWTLEDFAGVLPWSGPLE